MLGNVASSQPLLKGLIGHWPFAGSANDTSGNGNHGTVNGAVPASDKFGNPTSSYAFDGLSSTIISVPDTAILTPTDDMTLTCWVKPSTADQTSNARIVAKYGSGSVISYLLAFSGTSHKMRMVMDDTVTGRLTATSVTSVSSSSTWYFLCGRRSAGVVSIWINGVSEDSQTGTGTTLTNNANLEIGNNTIGPSGFMGNLSDVRLYNRALTSTEIATMYNTTVRI